MTYIGNNVTNCHILRTMIIHLDLDAFFCSCERLRNPSLVGRAIAVGGRGDPFIFDKQPSHAKKLITLNSGAFVPSLFHSEHDNSKYFNDGEKIRGIVTTASYEARACGVKTGMTIYETLQRCPHIILLPPDHLLYHTMSHELMEYLATLIPVMEQYSIDEMFGDLTRMDRGRRDSLFYPKAPKRHHDEIQAASIHRCQQCQMDCQTCDLCL